MGVNFNSSSRTSSTSMVERSTPETTHIGKLSICIIGTPLSRLYFHSDPWRRATVNMEWYDPQQITTEGGNLVITLDRTNRTSNHNLTYMGGMLSTWNKFCFTGGLIQGRFMIIVNCAPLTPET